MTDFIRALRGIADELEPFIQSTTPGASTWSGTAYVANEEIKNPDPYALAWWSTLRTIADLIEAQECPLSTNQLSYLKRTLFGGMGSLLDFHLDERSHGETAEHTNNHIKEKATQLFDLFQLLKSR